MNMRTITMALSHFHRDVGDHGGYTETGSFRIEILENLLSENDRVAEVNRAVLADAGVRAVNLMSSPGAGKTTLLKRTLARARRKHPHRRSRR